MAKRGVVLALFFLSPALAFATEFGNTIASASIILNFNEGGGTSVGDISVHKFGCTLNNSPVWVRGNNGWALRFDNTDAYVSCAVSDMPFGARPRTILMLVETANPMATVAGADKWLFKMGPDSTGLWSLSRRPDCGGCFSVWSDGSAHNSTLKLTTGAITGIAVTYGGALTSTEIYLVYNNTIEYQAITAGTVNTIPGTTQFGGWSASASDSGVILHNAILVNRHMAKNEIEGILRTLMRRGSGPSVRE